MKIVKILNPETVPNNGIEAITAPIFICKIYGLVERIEKASSIMRGNFEAIIEDGEKIVSTSCIVPQALYDRIFGQLFDNPYCRVRFSARVVLIPADNATGYTFVTENLFIDTVCD